MRPLALSILPETYAIARLEPAAPVPDWALGGSFSSFTRTADELSIVCREDTVPAEAAASRGWRALKVAGPLDFVLTGIVSSLSSPLAAAGIPIFVLSTHDTDYVLVRGESLGRAVEALTAAGHRFFERKP